MNPDETPITFEQLCDMLPRVPAGDGVLKKIGKEGVVRRMIKRGVIPSYENGTVFYRPEIVAYIAESDRWRQWLAEGRAAFALDEWKLIVDEVGLTKERAARLGLPKPPVPETDTSDPVFADLNDRTETLDRIAEIWKPTFDRLAQT